MEKCNFCAQRVRQAKYVAKEQGRLVRDGEFVTACAQVCPSDAITFGNLKDRGSRVSMERSDARSYLALGGDPDKHEFGIKTLPNVSYMAVVAHREPLGTGEQGHGSGHDGHNGDAHADGQTPEGHGNSNEAAHAPAGHETPAAESSGKDSVKPAAQPAVESTAPAHQ
jgi:molybdopterin-containing oxidoreductase family iron-sulfur binding subunit